MRGYVDSNRILNIFIPREEAKLLHKGILDVLSRGIKANAEFAQVAELRRILKDLLRD